MVQFEGSFQQLASDPIDTSLRVNILAGELSRVSLRLSRAADASSGQTTHPVVESARTMTCTMNIAAESLDQEGQGLRFEATDGGVNQVSAASTAQVDQAPRCGASRGCSLPDRAD